MKSDAILKKKIDLKMKDMLHWIVRLITKPLKSRTRATEKKTSKTAGFEFLLQFRKSSTKLNTKIFKYTKL